MGPPLDDPLEEHAHGGDLADYNVAKVVWVAMGKRAHHRVPKVDDARQEDTADDVVKYWYRTQ